MKNVYKYLFAAIVVTFLFTACNNRNKENDIAELSFYSAESYYFGDPQRADVDFYDLYLYDRNLTNNPNGNGQFIYLQMTTAPTSANEIVSGYYTINKRNQLVENSFEAGYWQSDRDGKYVVGSYVGRYEGSNSYYYPLENGELRVVRNGNYYTITGAVVADGKQYQVNYSGSIGFYDMVIPLPETLTHGEIWYHGNVDGYPAKIMSIRLGADDVKISDFSGSGDALQIELYTSQSATTIIPDGTYPVKVDQVQTFTAIDGYYDKEAGADYGTWYYTSDALSINKGYVRTEYLNGSTYRLEFEFTDDNYGYKFSGIYQGELSFVNKTSSPIAVRAAVRGVEAMAPISLKNSELRRSTERKVMEGERVDFNKHRTADVVKAIPQSARVKR